MQLEKAQDKAREEIKQLKDQLEKKYEHFSTLISERMHQFDDKIHQIQREMQMANYNISTLSQSFGL